MADLFRERLRRNEPAPTPFPPSPGGNAAMVGKVVTAPTALGTFFTVNPVTVTGAETQGMLGVMDVQGTTVLVYLAGNHLPAVGDYLICRFVDYRWVAEKPGTPSVPNPCNCTWPRVLSYVGQVGQAAATFYFPNAPDGGSPEPVYTLTWGTRPALIPKELQLLFYNYTGDSPDPWYVSMPDTAWFSAPIAGHCFGIPTTIYFYMWIKQCQANVLVIDAPYGNASTPDGTKGAGNNVISYYQTQCNPQFQMKNNLSQPPKIYGDHGADDIIPDALGGAGFYTHARQGL